MQRILNAIATSTVLLLINGNAFAGSQGTTLSCTKTAAVTTTETDTYTWTIQKTTPTQTPYTIGLGTNAPIPFTVTATRSGPGVTTSVGQPSGQICVTNTGSSSTQGLFITDRLEQYIGGTWTPIGTQITIPVPGELLPTQNHCYPYQFTGLTLNPSNQYRNHAVVSMDNYLGHEGNTFGTDVFMTVTYNTAVQTVDATAALTDTFQCPTGFSCTPSWTTQAVSSTSSIPNTVTANNVSICCGNTITGQNNISLVPSNTLVPQNTLASAQIFTGVCPPCGSGTGFSIDNVSDGNMVITPGATVIGGYNFKLAGGPTTSLILLNGTITIHVTCPDSSVQNIVIPLALQTYVSTTSNWYPTSTQDDPTGWQGSAPVPANLCRGVNGIASTGATFAGNFSTIPDQCPNVRFHYQQAPIGGGANWSNTNVRVCGVCGPVCAPISTLEKECKQLEKDLGVNLGSGEQSSRLHYSH